MNLDGGETYKIKHILRTHFRHGKQWNHLCSIEKLKNQFNLSLILHKNQEMIFASKQVLKKQPCLVSVSLKGTI